MEIQLDRVVDEPFAWQEILVPAAGEVDLPGALGFGEVLCRGRVRPIQSDYLLEATLTYVQTLTCMRCLEGFDMPVTSDISLLIQIRPPDHTAAEVELEEEDLETLFLPQPRLDTRPLLVEQLHLGMPMKPLCREDCAGLCPSCGTNLNHGPCGCQPRNVDPRWSALGKLRH